MAESTEEIKKLRLELGIDKEEVLEEEISDKGSSESSDPYLEEALKSGYDPNYKGPNKKTAEQFVKDGSFFKKIDTQNKKIDELIAFNKQQMELNKKVEIAAYEKALRDIQSKKLQAIKEADVDGALQFEKQAEEVKHQLETSKTTPVLSKEEHLETKLSKQVLDFQEKHKSWLNGTTPEDRKMKAFLKGKVTEFLEVDPNYPEEEAIKEIEEELHKKFPNKFENQNQNKPSMITKSTVSTDGKKLPLEKLTDRQKDFIKRAKQIDPNYKTEEYIRQLKLTGQLEDD